ncbi:hypothetical protein HK102_002278, partial [Quaeritorhiza haematococci]
MWKAHVGAPPAKLDPKINQQNKDDDDDWETDPDFVNDVSEKDQRWGHKDSKTNEDMEELRKKVIQKHEEL